MAPKPIHPTSTLIARILAAVIVAGALMVLTGWAVDLPRLKGIKPGWVEMKPNTAAGLLCLGLSGMSLAGEPVGRRRRTVGVALAAMAVTIGGLTLWEYVTRLDLRIDELLFKDDPNEVGTSSPGRMAVATTVCFILSGLALVGLDAAPGGRRWPSTVLAAVTTAVSIPPAIGYVFGITKLYSFMGATQMAVHTAVLMILGSATTMIARPDRGFIRAIVSRRAGGYFARRVLPAAVLLPLALGAILSAGKDFGTGDVRFEATLSAVLCLLVFLGVVWFTAAALNRLDEERLSAERKSAARAERAAVADELADRERRFHELADAMPQLVWTSRPDGWVDYWNARATAAFGRPSELALGHQWLSLLHEDDRERASLTWAAACEGGRPYEIEYRMRMADGSYRWTLSRGLPGLDGEGNVVRWYGTCTDIDAQRQTMAALKMATDRAEKAAKLKDEFLGIVSHELRTPLMAILSWSNLLRVKPDDHSSVAEGVDAIHRNAVAQSKLVEDLLDVTRGVHGKLKIEPAAIELGEVIRAVVESVRVAAAVKGVAVTADLNGFRGMIRADPNRLRQALSNLIENGVKFTPAGGRVDVSARGDGDSIHITVADTGQGIPTDFLPKLFEPFSQHDATTTRRHGGLGLGLVIVRMIAELHGGTVRARSEGAGMGTTFELTLPNEISRGG